MGNMNMLNSIEIELADTEKKYAELEEFEKLLKEEDSKFEQVIEAEYQQIVKRRDSYKTVNKKLIDILEDRENEFYEMRNHGRGYLDEAFQHLNSERVRLESRIRELQEDVSHNKEGDEENGVLS